MIAVQFHPEASPGPYDCMFVFDRFKEIIDNGKITDGVKPAKPKPKAKVKAKKQKKKVVKIAKR